VGRKGRGLALGWHARKWRADLGSRERSLWLRKGAQKGMEMDKKKITWVGDRRRGKGKLITGKIRKRRNKMKKKSEIPVRKSREQKKKRGKNEGLNRGG